MSELGPKLATDLAFVKENSVTPTATEMKTIRPGKESNRLVWIDMEMTGLRPNIDRILEVAVVVTDMDLEILGQSTVFAIHQTEEVLSAMDGWNRSTHGRSGLIDRVKESTFSEFFVEDQIIKFLELWTIPGKSPLCGNSISQDRRFMVRYMPRLESWFHYRNLDVSVLKELVRNWGPSEAKSFVKKGSHTALEDVLESIHELRHYREHLWPKKDNRPKSF